MTGGFIKCRNRRCLDLQMALKKERGAASTHIPILTKYKPV